MEINFGSSIGTNAMAGQIVSIAHQEGGSKVDRSTGDLRITQRSADIVSAEPLADVPESALRRDDALGNLVSFAFNLPPPAMPVFSD